MAALLRESHGVGRTQPAWQPPQSIPSRPHAAGLGRQTGQGAASRRLRWGSVGREAQKGDVEQAEPKRRVGREGMAGPHSGTGGGRGRRAAREQSRIPRLRPTSTHHPRRHGTGGAESIAFDSKAKLGSPGPLLPGSGTLRQPGSSGDPQHRHPGRDPPAQPRQRGFSCPLPLFSI